METWFLMEEDKLDEFIHEYQGIETTEQYSRQAVIAPLMKAFNMTLQDVILYVFAAKIFDGLTPIDEVEREFTARIEETFLSKQKEQIPTTTYPDKVPKTQQRRRHHTLRPNLPFPLVHSRHCVQKLLRK